MKTMQLIETENVKGANLVLKNLLERTRTEIVGIGLFYGKAGLGKSRWATKIAQLNGYTYLRLETNTTPKYFLTNLLSKLLQKTMPYYEVTGTQNDIYCQILDILQRDMNITIVLDEIEYAFRNVRILSSIRDMADQSLATFILVGMEKAKQNMLNLDSHYFDRCNGFYEFKPLNLSDTEIIINEIAEVKMDKKIMQYVYGKCNGTMRIVMKYIDALERIARKMKKSDLAFDEIKNIITLMEA